MNLQEELRRIQTLMSLNENIKMGSSDTDSVIRLQRLLGFKETGIFDSEMDDCVREFQEFADIKVDGIVGPITQGKLDDTLLGDLKGWTGCKGTSSMSKTPNSMDKSVNYDTPVKSLSSSIVGSGWNSCKAWRNKGGLNSWGDKIKIEKSSSQFKISYNGPSSGLSIAHAKGGGDTIHQLYNVLICEINPFLAGGKLLPDIENISTSGGKNGSNSTLTITIPLKTTKNTYQLDRRGGWNHDPGSSKMESKCKEINGKGGKCIGPVKNVVQGPFGKITEYFVVHTM
jgi:peptidoglycan hydrolase-like protein with peptidoglycan-binding domain